MDRKIFLIAISALMMFSLVSAVDANQVMENVQEGATNIMQGRTPISGSMLAVMEFLDGVTKVFAGLLNTSYGQAALLTFGLLMFPLALVLGLLVKIAKFVPWIVVIVGVFLIITGVFL